MFFTSFSLTEPNRTCFSLVFHLPNLIEHVFHFTNLIEHRIELTDDTPVFTRQYPIPQALQEVLQEQISLLLEQGIIELSRSPYG